MAEMATGMKHDIYTGLWTALFLFIFAALLTIAMHPDLIVMGEW